MGTEELTEKVVALPTPLKDCSALSLSSLSWFIWAIKRLH